MLIKASEEKVSSFYSDKKVRKVAFVVFFLLEVKEPTDKQQEHFFLLEHETTK